MDIGNTVIGIHWNGSFSRSLQDRGIPEIGAAVALDVERISGNHYRWLGERALRTPKPAATK